MSRGRVEASRRARIATERRRRNAGSKRWKRSRSTVRVGCWAKGTTRSFARAMRRRWTVRGDRGRKRLQLWWRPTGGPPREQNLPFRPPRFPILPSPPPSFHCRPMTPPRLQIPHRRRRRPPCTMPRRNSLPELAPIASPVLPVAPARNRVHDSVRPVDERSHLAPIAAPPITPPVRDFARPVEPR